MYYTLFLRHIGNNLLIWNWYSIRLSCFKSLTGKRSTSIDIRLFWISSWQTTLFQLNNLLLRTRAYIIKANFVSIFIINSVETEDWHLYTQEEYLLLEEEVNKIYFNIPIIWSFFWYCDACNFLFRNNYELSTSFHHCCHERYYDHFILILGEFDDQFFSSISFGVTALLRHNLLVAFEVFHIKLHWKW